MRVVVTLDADFHMWMAIQGAKEPSVIRIRIEGLHAEPLAELLLALLKEYDEDLQAGALVSVEGTRVRLRRLPL